MSRKAAQRKNKELPSLSGARSKTLQNVFSSFQEHCTLSYLAKGPDEGKLFTQVRK